MRGKMLQSSRTVNLTSNRKVIDLLGNTPAEDERLTQLRASLEEELLTRIEGYQPQ